MNKTTFYLGLFIFFSSIAFPNSNNIKNWEQKLNDTILFYTPHGLKAIPEYKLMRSTSTKFSDKVYIIDPEKKQISILCTKGEGPDKFKSASNFFTNNSKIYVQDLLAHKLLVYSAYDYSLVDILLPKNALRKTIRLLGANNNKYFGINYTLDFQNLPPKEYDVIAVYDKDFLLKKTLLSLPREQNKIKFFDTSFLFIKGAEKNYFVVFFAQNFNAKKGIFNLLLINSENYQKVYIPIKIPRKFFTWSEYDKTTDLYKLTTSFSGMKYRATPTHIRRLGLNNKLYFNYIYRISQYNVEILINELDIDTLTVKQYIYKTDKGIEPFLFTDKYVYCTDMKTEDFKLKILPKSKVLYKTLNNFQFTLTKPQ